MGGNAIKNAERMDLSEYQQLMNEMRYFLREIYDFYPNEFVFVEAYKSKVDFGDMDIVVKGSQESSLMNGITAELESIYGAEVIKNGNVLSVGIPLREMGTTQDKIVQVDFIFEENVQMAANYYAWNDLGNLMGRIAHNLGFKFGHKGLIYVVREGTQVHEEIIVSQDMKEILPFLGLSYEKWEKGFDTLEDIFEFAASSEFYHPDIYLLHNRNNASRIRDRKRKTYQEFLKWSEKLSYPPYEENIDRHTLGLDRSYHLFGKKWMDTYAAALTAVDRKRRMKEWWNGDMAKAITQLEGKELGAFMAQMQEAYNMHLCFDLGINANTLADALWAATKEVKNDKTTNPT